MRKITFAIIAALTLSVSAFGQVKSSGTIPLISGMSAKLDLDNTTSTATLTLSGPSDRWFGFAFKNEFPFNAQADNQAESGMAPGNDLVYFNGTTLVDCMQLGIGETPSIDAVNNWTVLSNTVTGDTRIIVATRDFVTGDSDDYAFNDNVTQMDFAAARRGTASYIFSSHASNRQVFPNISMTEVLAINDRTLASAQIFPNPSNGNFIVKSNSPLEKINVYSQTGAFIKTIQVQNSDTSEVRISGLSTGIYLIELQNSSEKSWKKVLIN